MSPRPTAAQKWKKKYQDQLEHRMRHELEAAERIQQLKDELAAAKTNTNVLHHERYDLQQTLTRARAEHREELHRVTTTLYADVMSQKKEVDRLNQNVADLRKWKQQALDRCARYEQRIGVLTDSLRDVAVEKDILY